MKSFDIAIIGGGIIGLCIAHQIHEKSKGKSKIILIEKEEHIGRHSSGRNSGVIHAGVYYKPKTLKARVCVNGGKRLTQWINMKGLEINRCGKIIVPTKLELDSQLDELESRGIQNGATVEMLTNEQISSKADYIRTASGRGLWSPNTSVVNAKQVMEALQEDLKEKGILFKMGEYQWKIKNDNYITLSDGESIYYEHLINCAGLQAERIAKRFKVGRDYVLIPFKGMYWRIKKECRIQPKFNIYPVPDLEVPFLGVHFTPNTATTNPTVNIGPTATLALGRENYEGAEGLEPVFTARNISLLARQYIQNKGNIRQYTHQQAFLGFHPLLVKAAQNIIPCIRSTDIVLTNKVAIRPQLFNIKTGNLEDDFLCLQGLNSTHILNAISPAFTASFELADEILKRTPINI